MTVDDILLNINKHGFDSFVPLTSIRTEEDKQALRAKGYMITVCYTLDEFKSKVGIVDFPYDKIFYTPSMNAECYYFNRETLGIHLINTFLFETEKHEGSRYLELIEDIEEKVAEGDFDLCVAMLQGTLAIEYIQMVVREKADKVADLYDFFMDTYNTSDYGFSVIERDVLDKVIAKKTDDEKAKTAELLKDYPDELTIYRGGNSESSKSDEGYSWSFDINVANFFACRRGNDDGYIATGKVKKADVIEVFLDRNEDEVIVFPEKVYDIEETPIFGIDYIEAHYPDIISMYQKYRDKIDDLKFAQDSKVHGKLHEKRVLLMALLIADMMELPSADKKALAEAAVYHDVMRTDDSREESHGLTSRKNYESLVKKPDELVGFICEYHCKDDELAYEEIKRNRKLSKNRTRAKLLYDIFKDADALDRVRFGIRDLDLGYLRNDISKQLTLIARINFEQVK